MVNELTLRCRDCEAAYLEPEGWDGRCALCCSLSDDHAEGLHTARFRVECRRCRLAEPVEARDAA